MGYRVIGLMSGTSLDGLDIACCTFGQENGMWEYELVEGITVPFPDELKSQLRKAMDLSGHDLIMLDRHLGRWMGQEVKKVIEKTGFTPDLIGSHGHTIFHEPA
ncbi:MAG: anhydro-N-acetylmuramic acid kinase, partial [Cyclobacteriaceae bacterium]